MASEPLRVAVIGGGQIGGVDGLATPAATQTMLNSARTHKTVRPHGGPGQRFHYASTRCQRRAGRCHLAELGQLRRAPSDTELGPRAEELGKKLK